MAKGTVVFPDPFSSPRMKHSYSAALRPARAGRPAPFVLAGRLWLVLLLALPGLARAQAPAWAEATTGSLTQANGTSSTRAVATDASGNVFVTGSFTGSVAFGSTLLTSRGSNDLFVAKYVPATSTWAWAQSGGGTGADIGFGVAVSGGSVYVTGQLVNNTANASGVLFGGTGTTAGTVQVNGASGTNAQDLVLAKYTDNGTSADLGWTQVGGGASADVGYGVAVSGGSVYVTGYLTNSTVNSTRVLFGGTGTTPGTVQQNGTSGPTTQDLVLAKYTDNGSSAALGWTQVGGGTLNDMGQGVAVSGGSVYVTGYIQNNTANASGVLFGGTGTTAGTVQVNGATTANGQDLVLAKYTDNGASATLGWTQVGGGISTDLGFGVAVSGASVYVTGQLVNNTANGSGVLFGGTGTTPGTVQVNGATAANSPDLVLAKYTDNGTSATLGWTQVGGGTGTDQGNGVAVSGGSVYVTGVLVNTTANASGVRFGGTGTTAGTVQVNGASGTNSQDLVLAQYTDNGTTATLGWTQVGGGISTDLGFGVAVSGGSVYAGGYLSSTVTAAFGAATGAPVLGTIGNRAVLAQADAGTGTWQAVAPATNGGTSLTRAVATDASGNVFVTGSFMGQVAFGGTLLTSRGGNDLFVAKYVPATGTWAWAQSGGGTGTDAGYGVAVSGSSVYVTGQLVNNTANASGVLFGGTGTTAGTVQVNGASAANSFDLVLAKYTDNGTSATLGWTQVGGGTGNDIGYGVAVSGSSVYVTGQLTNNTTNDSGVLFGGTGTTPGTVPQYGASGTNSQDLVLAKYTDNGTSATLGWTQVGGGISNDIGYGVAVSGGSVYVTGQLVNNTANASGVLFGGTGTTAGTVQVNGASGTNSQDLVLAQYTDNGTTATLGWTQVGGGISIDIGFGVAVSGQNVVAGGYITPSASFGSLTVANPVGGQTNVLARVVGPSLVPLAPTLTAVAPSPGGLGQAITLTGTSLGSPTALTINGADALAGIVSNSGTRLVVRVPVTAAATGNVVITTSTGTASLAFAVMAPPGNALAFDGVDDYLSLGSTPAAANLGPAGFTLEAWVYFDGNTGVNSILRKTGDYNLYLNGGKLSAEVWPVGGGDASWRILNGAVLLPANRWTHVAATWNPTGTAFLLYVNGVLDAGASGRTGSVGGSEPLNVGRSSFFSQYFKGRLDEVRIYSTALTAAQLWADMASTDAAVPASLALYYNFDQGTPATASTGDNAGLTTLYDLSPNATPATLTGFALASGNTASNYVASYAMVVPVVITSTARTATGFTVNWTAPALGTATSYLLDVSTTPDFSAPIAGSPFATTATSYVLTGLNASSAYYYRVRALNSALAQPDQGAFSNVVSQATPLPVELTAFAATAAGPTAVRLAWATASEQNSASFEVQRSADGRTFTPIGTVAAAGSSRSPRRYELTDGQLPAGAATLYYRLKQVDADGTFSYSPVRTVALAGAAAGLALYPNPATGAATLTGAQPGAAVTVVDALGRAVTTATADASGTAALVLPAGLPAGVYVVRAGTRAVRLTVE